MTAKKSVPGPSKAESRADQTHAAATEIIDRETSAREEKTQRLRAARLEREAEERAKAVAAAKAAKRKAQRKAKSAS